MTKHDDSHPITSVINTGELMRQLAQREADHRRRVQDWTADRVKELTGGTELLDIALHHSDFDVAVAALSNDHMNADDRRYAADNATDTRVRDAAEAEATRRGEHRDGRG
ncbi:hypothetical protein ACH9D2_12385 [Kocuria sp. M4R2S49]|uniref:hypothetical protein n=1 Tax=Kocuria rhizosphaericola TaxID=3376284 RepID=UPI0037B6D368